MKVFWDFFVKDITMWLLALNFLILVTILFPPQLGSPADPLAPAPEGIHPEWYFMSQYQFLKIFGNILPGAVGEIISIGLMACALLLWAIVPLIDNTGKVGKRAKAATYIGLLSLVILVVLTAWAYLAI
jgi:cytochrome b6